MRVRLKANNYVRICNSGFKNNIKNFRGARSGKLTGCFKKRNGVFHLKCLRQTINCLVFECLDLLSGLKDQFANFNPKILMFLNVCVRSSFKTFRDATHIGYINWVLLYKKSETNCIKTL